MSPEPGASAETPPRRTPFSPAGTRCTFDQRRDGTLPKALADRYDVIRELGRGGAGVTYLARETATGKDVVVKLLPLGMLTDWKTAELLEREASVLRGLHHPFIPAYIDYFPAEPEAAQQFVLVREYVAGTSLQARVESGWRGTEEQIRDICVRLVRIVSYIHSVRPPIIHRDINPRNIIQRDDGEVFLLDFGGVQDAIRVSTGATNTIVGTPGYTPMEQFVGRASVRSDLYALAATTLFLLTHRNPADLPAREMKVALLEDRTLPEPVDGTRSAVPTHPPHGSRIQRTAEGESGGFLIPGSGWGRGFPASSGFLLFWVIFGGYWGSSFFRSGRPWSSLLPLAPFLLMGLSSVAWFVTSVFGKLEIAVSEGGLACTRRVFSFSRRREIPIEDVGDVTIEEGAQGRRRRGSAWGGAWGGGWGWPSRYRSRNRGQSARLSVDLGITTLRFGENLSAREQEWLRDALNEQIRRARAARKELG